MKLLLALFAPALAAAMPLNNASATPYGNPASGCMPGSMSGKVAGMCLCLPKCTGTTCPAAPAGATGKPTCDVSPTGKPPPVYCTLGCSAATDCPAGAECNSGICGYACGGPAPPPGPPAPPAPPGPAPPGPAPPAGGGHWANPGKSGSGCGTSGDTPVHFPDSTHECCLPKCTGTTCPAAPAGASGTTPACDVSTTGKPPYTFCSLNWSAPSPPAPSPPHPKVDGGCGSWLVRSVVGKSTCPSGGTCVSVGAVGVCTYANPLLPTSDAEPQELYRILPNATLRGE